MAQHMHSAIVLHSINASEKQLRDGKLGVNL